MNEFDALSQRLSTTDERLWLGSLVWYSFSGVRISHNQMVAALVSAGIDQSLPLPPKDDDVFRRVCSKAERKRVPTSIAGIFDNYLVRDLNADADKVYKRLVVERVDAGDKKLGYEQLYDITFEKATGNIITKRLSMNGASPDGEAICLGIQTEYSLQRGTMNSYAVREWTRRFILSLSAVRVREGVYFVRQEHNAKIEALEQFLTSLPGGVIFHSLPLLDDRKQRDMLRASFESEVSDEIDSLIGDIQDIKSQCQGGKKRGISNSKYEQYLNRYHSLVERTNEYSDLLEEKLGTTHSRLEIFMRSMVELTAFKKTE